jgi:thiol-disulfide isomerase/thioredoxin
MKYLLVITIVLFSTSIFAKSVDANITIKGKLENAEGKTIVLEYFDNGKPIIIDSCSIKKNGKFEISATGVNPDFYRIGFGNNNFALLILSKGQNLTFGGDAADLNKSYTVTGSKESEEIKEFVTGLNKFSDSNNEINEKYKDPNSTPEEKEALKKKGESTKADFVAFRDEFIGRTYNSLSALTTISHLNDLTDFDQIKKIANGISEKYPESKYDISMQEKVTQIEVRVKQEEEAKKAREASEIGHVAPAMNFKSPEGKVITLASLEGNYVLIDFWASWCGPCRRENPNVVKAYNKYKEKGFTVFSVSLDKDKNRWVAAIKQDGLIWPNHVSDLKQWQTEAVKLYGFRGIPHTVLLDKNGVIIAKNLRGAALEDKLKELIGF